MREIYGAVATCQPHLPSYGRTKDLLWLNGIVGLTGVRLS